MILLCGIPSETPVAMIAQRLSQLNIPHGIFNQRNFDHSDVSFELAAGRITGWIHLEGNPYRLETVTGVYTRLMDFRQLPELHHEPATSVRYQHCHRLHDTLAQWYEIAPIRVVNRSAPMASNASKPYQAQLIQRCGFSIPETLITNDPALVHDFCSCHPKVIYKSISGIRSIVQMMQAEDLNRLDRIRWCPTQFQVFVEGINIRVHTVDQAVFATAIDTSATDYRYASQQGGRTQLKAIDIADDLAQRCIQLGQSLGLPFAGIDLKITPEGEVFCFEVNPSPGFSYYESQTGQPISSAVAQYLARVD